MYERRFYRLAEDIPIQNVQDAPRGSAGQAGIARGGTGHTGGPVRASQSKSKTRSFVAVLVCAGACLQGCHLTARGSPLRRLRESLLCW
jgi:hypothetical protein